MCVFTTTRISRVALVFITKPKSWLIGKNSDAGRDWGQEEKGTTEDEMAGWHHWLDGRESGWTPGVGDGRGGLACCNSWGRKESDTTERLNWTDSPYFFIFISRILSFPKCHINIIIPCVTSWGWPFSLSIMPLRFISVAVCSFLLLLRGISWYGYATICLTTYIEWHLDWFPFLTITNRAAMSIHIQPFIWV